MELNFTEYNNYTNTNLDNQTEDYSKYWEQPKTEKKKKVSFNDILTNMNLVVGKNGVLQQMQHQSVEPLYEEQQKYLPQQQQYLPQQQQQYLPQQQQQYLPQQQQYLPQQQQYLPQQQYNIKKIEQNQIPIDPSVKHSFIYNKYFKDYVDAYKPEPEVLVPKTMEEYRQMVYEQNVKDAEERKRIAQIKSTKLMFTTNQNSNNEKNSANIRPSKNNLRMMNFK